MIYVALACSIAAFVSGIAAIGCGRDWQFTTRDILLGRENALAYIWVSLSTAFTIAHTSVISFWLWINGPALVGPNHTNMWMSFHAGMGLLFLTAHLFIKRKFKRQRPAPPVYLWGTPA